MTTRLGQGSLSASAGERAEVRCRIGIRHGHLDAFLEQQMNFAIRRFQAHERTVAGPFIRGGSDGLGRNKGFNRSNTPRGRERMGSNRGTAERWIGQ